MSVILFDWQRFFRSQIRGRFLRITGFKDGQAYTYEGRIKKQKSKFKGVWVVMRLITTDDQVFIIEELPSVHPRQDGGVITIDPRCLTSNPGCTEVSISYRASQVPAGA